MKKRNEGFSLVELIIAIAIMAILASAIGVSVIRYIQKARASAALEEARLIVNAAQHALAEVTTKDVDYNTNKTFVKADGTTIAAGAITNKMMATAQTDDTYADTNADYSDYLVARVVLDNLLSSKDDADVNYLQFNGQAQDPIGRNCESFANTYGCPGFILVYDAEGMVVMLEYYAHKALIHYEDGEYVHSESPTFIPNTKLVMN